MIEKTCTDYVQDIFDSINEIEGFVEGLSFKEFERDKKTVNAVIRSLEVIGEASKNIPKDVQSNYANIPWKKMAGMRDKLIHEYFGVDLETIWQTIKEDLPNVKPLIKNLQKKVE